MKVSFTKNTNQTTPCEKHQKSKKDDSSMSIKFGDCSAVAGVLSDKSLIFFEDNVLV
jgi:hypothetical protein